MLHTGRNRNTVLAVFAVVCVLALGFVTAGTPLVAQEQASDEEPPDTDGLQKKSRSQLRKMLRSKLKRLNDLQTQTFEARQEMNRRIQETRSGQEQLEQEVQEAKNRRSDKKSKLKTLQNRLADLKKQKKSLQNALDQLDTSADRLQDQLTTHIHQTVPYERKKRQTVRSSGTSEEPSDSDPVRRLRNITDAVRDELTDGSTSELLHRRVPLSPTNGARKKHARLVRLGQNTLFYVTEDGKHSGYYVQRNNEWQVKQASSRQAQRFRHALDVLRGQRQPERVSLPVIIPSTNP